MQQTADFWIRHLDLKQHPEGGYFREVYRAGEVIHKKGLPGRYSSFRSFATSIYFLLKSEHFSAFHRLKSDEVWHFYQGSPLRLYIILADGRLLEVRLGQDPGKKELLQFTVPRGAWFAAKPEGNRSFSLMGCSVSPGFDFDDFEMGSQEALIRQYPRHAALIRQYTILP